MKKESKNKNKKLKRRKSSMHKQDPIPKGFGTVTPYLKINGAAKAIDFYKDAFGAKKIGVVTLPDGKILHARMKIGDSILMLSDEFQGNTASPTSIGSNTVTIHVYSKNVDKLWEKAVEAGAKIVMPLDNQFWGERYGQLLDPFGHSWSLSMQVRMTRREREAKRKVAMEMFTQGKHPTKGTT
jgi:PhnB protein